jgi:AcrR family transcriptional regulator/DNA-binding MarR family transcriptional regulator
MAAELSGESEMPERRSDGGGRYAADSQRGRLLSATFVLVGERGYEGVTVRSVAERAGVSNRVFYECFSDREDCFLAAFNHAVDGLESEMRVGWESQLGWTARVRGGLAALLRALDREPAVRRLVFVEALAAGPRVLARRARVLESLAGVVDEGRVNASAPERLPGLVAEGVVGATFGVIHARLLELRPGPLIGLLGSLMATIVLPYRGSAAAAKELGRPTPRQPAKRRDGDGFSHRRLGDVSPVDYRLTIRAQMALAAVGGRPGLNNREVSEIIGLADQGQISRMMKRQQSQGLIENVQGHNAKRQVRAWRLTADGEAVIDAHKPLKLAQRTAGKGGRLATKSNRKGATFTPASPGPTERAPLGDREAGPRPLRMTGRTHEVLAAVATLSVGDGNPTNREVANAAGIKDQGQISKLLARLEGHGLLENTGGHPAAGNAWQLTERGAELLAAGRPSQEGAGR